MVRGAAGGQGAIVGWRPLIEPDLREGRVQRLFDEDIRPTHGDCLTLPAQDAPRPARLRREVQIVADWLAAHGDLTRCLTARGW